MLPHLLATHAGQFVAVHEGRVVDSGPNRLEVAVRVLRAVGADIYVGFVGTEPEPVGRSGVVRDHARLPG